MKLCLSWGLRKQRVEQVLVARMQKSTRIEVVDSGGQRLSAFRIPYRTRTRNQWRRGESDRKFVN